MLCLIMDKILAKTPHAMSTKTIDRVYIYMCTGFQSTFYRKSLFYSGLHSTLAFTITFLYCRCPPFSSPCLITPGNATHDISLWARVSSSSPPRSSIMSDSKTTRWCGRTDGMYTLSTAFWATSSRASSMELLTNTRRPESRASDEVVEQRASRRRVARVTTRVVKSDVDAVMEDASRRRRPSVEERH